MGNTYTYRQDSSGRVQPVETRYLAHPGLCLLCGRPPVDGDIFANLGTELEYYGVAYLCLDCCAEIADFIRFVHPEAAKRIGDTNIKYSHRIEELEADLERAKGLLHARIDLAINGEFDSNGTTGVPVSETESESTKLHQTLDRGKSEFGKSGTK